MTRLSPAHHPCQRPSSPRRHVPQASAMPRSGRAPGQTRSSQRRPGRSPAASTETSSGGSPRPVMPHEPTGRHPATSMDGVTLSDGEGSGRTHAEPPLWAAAMRERAARRSTQNWPIWACGQRPVMADMEVIVSCV
jgi:hypothetical protein